MDFSIYEVGPRDGLQSSDTITPTYKKVELIERLAKAGIQNIEVGAMVNPEKVPNMADSAKVYEQISHLEPFCNLGVLIPNKRGLDRAKEVGASKFNVFFSPSDEFNIRNLGNTLDLAYPSIKNMLEDENRDNIRAYISCAFGCPFEGMPNEVKLMNVLKKADEIANEIVLCDTIGVCHPTRMVQTLELTKRLDSSISLHLHNRKNGDTNIFSNVKAAVEWGITDFDSSIAGLGGCPFIPNSGSNLSTNQLIHWADNNGYDTGVDLYDLAELTDWLTYKNNRMEILI